MKQTYYRIIAALIGVVILMFIFIAVRPEKIITETIEVTKEVEVEVIKEVEVVKEVEVIKEVEKEVVVEVEVEKEPTYKYNLSSVEREMLARLVYLEANTEGLECQQAVASVVINRWISGKWGNTIASVIYSKYQFSPSGLIYKTTPTETNYAAVDHVLKNGSILPEYVMYFRTSYGFSKTWEGYAEYTQIDKTYFGYFIKDKK